MNGGKRNKMDGEMSYEEALKEIDDYLRHNIVPTSVVDAVEILKQGRN